MYDHTSETVLKYSNNKKTCKLDNYYFLVFDTFLLATILLLEVFIVSYYFLKYRLKHQ